MENNEAPAPKKRINGNKKGKSYENELCTQLAHIFPKIRRNLEFHRLDAEKKMDLKGCAPWVFQSKRHKKYESAKVLLETIAEEGEHRVLVTKADRLPALAILEWETLKMLIEVYHGMRPPLKSEEQVAADKQKLNIKNLPPFNNGSMKDLGL